MTQHGPHTTHTQPPDPYVSCPTWTGHPLTDTSWQQQASCPTSDPDLFLPEARTGSMAAISAAKKVCRACPIKIPCLVYALERGERYGVWGAHGRVGLANLRKTLNITPAAHQEAA